MSSCISLLQLLLLTCPHSKRLGFVGSLPVLQVFDSAASQGSWAEALGFGEPMQQHRHLLHDVRTASTAAAALTAGGAAAGSVSEPVTPHSDAAVQTDLSGPAESAGSTAAAPAATEPEGAAPLPQQLQQQHEEEDGEQASSRQPQPAAAGAGEAAASSALLAAARHEILRLQELNRQLMQVHAEGA